MQRQAGEYAEAARRVGLALITIRVGQATGVPAQMQRALASSDPQLPVSGFYEMKDLMAATLARQRIAVALLAAMSSLALLLSAVGIFALVANIVAQRTREIGIRMPWARRFDRR